MFDSPLVRLVARAVLAGVGAALAVLQSGGSWQNAVYAGLALALSFGGVETVTPINKTVGLGK